MRLFIKTAFLVFFLALATYLVLYFSPDQALEPEAAAWLKLEPIDYSATQNSYFTLMGFLAPVDHDPRQFGITRTKAWAQAIENHEKTGAEPDAAAIARTHPETSMPVDKRFADLCVMSAQNCLSWYAEHGETVAELSGVYAPWLARYQSLYQKPRYHDPIGARHVNMPPPNFRTMLNMQQLHHAQLLAHYTQGEHDIALSQLADDLSYARSLLANNNHLITKMVAVKMIVDIFHVYSQFLDGKRIPLALLQTIAKLPALDTAEKNMQQVEHTEFQALHYTNITQSEQSRQTGMFDKLLSALLSYKPNATMNHAFSQYREAAQYGNLSPEALLEIRSQASAGLFWWHYGYNMTGALLVEISNPAHHVGYALRIQALDGLLNLLKLKARFRAEGRSLSAFPEFLENQRGNAPGLFKAHPVQWDEKYKRLYYNVPKAAESVLKPIYRVLYSAE
ncbi:hypothetical protein [Candidatus Venteria ishoeyi]|uniref:Uncharacterized protein n=1 Tax=Candidatus Venteria ishoeyi TaxID=1899563 RepID=A0A1H6FGJ4_9GAMM|nr:hypothetical protein [Candidatus Venteria ishoeyi]SEH08276.1 Uncharacterised protein [Candidatus Venteria ishoeyi]